MFGLKVSLLKSSFIFVEAESEFKHVVITVDDNSRRKPFPLAINMLKRQRAWRLSNKEPEKCNSKLNTITSSKSY